MELVVILASPTKALKEPHAHGHVACCGGGMKQTHWKVSSVGLTRPPFFPALIRRSLAQMTNYDILPNAGVSQISQVQALDIFLVQANTNAILAHFVPLTSFLWSQKSLPPE